MAEAIVSLAIQRMADLLIQEADFLGGVGDDVERLRAELDRMNSVLKDADYKQNQTQLIRTLVRQIRDLVYEAEDVIDSFILDQVAHQGIINRFTNIFTKPSHLHKAGTKIKSIQTRLEDISKSLPAYDRICGGSNISSVTGMMQQKLRRSYSHVEEEDDVVSLESMTSKVLARLMTVEDHRSLAVVSIVGMGGIGKTTLAKRVYNHLDVKRHFDSTFWAFISQDCKPREVFYDVLIKALSPSKEEREIVDKLKEDELIKRVFDVLKEKRYLIVLDDTWRREDWNALKPAFSQGKKGSKILVTTRIKDVASFADPCDSPIELPFLTDADSWKLFKKKVFPENTIESEACSREFEILGREMVNKCGGLPLAIVALGGLLSTKRSRAQWEMVQRNIHAHLNKVQQQDHQYGAVNGILVLSYNDLPYHLKPCFMYLGHYPEDWEISKKELIRLWIAEGFISPSMESGEMLMEDVAEQFLEELINRCLVQVGKRDRTGKGVKTCHIHDLLRDLCVDKAREENFLGITVDETLTTSMPRRIAIHPSKRDFDLKVQHPNLRSLLLFQNEGLIKLDISKCKHFKFLRVVTTVKRVDENKWHVSSEIGNLHLLRYLRLENNGEIILPQSIGKLKSLHTLHVEFKSRLRLPNVVFKLKRLKHILLFDRHYTEYCRTHISLPVRADLKNIETLKYVRVKNLIENYGNGNGVPMWLSNIGSLGVYFERSKDVEPILKAVLQSNRLHSLDMTLLIGKDYSFQSFPDLEALSECHHLSKLFLHGNLREEDPRHHHHHHVLKFLPPNIVELTLWYSYMKQDPMVVLEKLPHLRILRLSQYAYKGSQLKCSANGFLQLDSLQIWELSELEEWEIKEGAMPLLRSLHLWNVLKLSKFPKGLRYVTTLQKMKLQGIKRSLIERIQVIDGREGDDFYKISNVPSIQIINTRED